MEEQTIAVSKPQEFAGDKKVLVHFLAPYEKKFINAVLPFIP